eukprot:gene1498-2891_t
MNLEFKNAVLVFAIHSVFCDGGNPTNLAVDFPKSSNSDDVQEAILFDADANLLHSEFSENGITPDDLIKTAVANGITRFLVPGSSIQSSEEALSLAKRNSHVLATAGIHPYHTAEDLLSEQTSNLLENMIQNELCICVGECGLDYSEGFPDKSFQKDWFRTHLRFACQYQKPLFLHSRNANYDFKNILNEFGFEEGKEPPVPGIVHCFTENCDELKRYLNMGFHIGLTGYVINNPSKLQEYSKIIPLDKLLIETDAPYMGFAGCRATEMKKKTAKYPNVPASLPKIATAIADVYSVPYSTFVQMTTRNALRLFRISI